MVNTNPNMKVLLNNAGYKNKQEHRVHPLVGNSPNNLFVNNAQLSNNPQVNPPAAANNNQSRNQLKNYLKNTQRRCEDLKNEYKDLLQRMKDINCNMNGIAQ